MIVLHISFSLKSKKKQKNPHLWCYFVVFDVNQRLPGFHRIAVALSLVQMRIVLHCQIVLHSEVLCCSLCCMLLIKYHKFSGKKQTQEGKYLRHSLFLQSPAKAMKLIAVKFSLDFYKHLQSGENAK